ncbi:MAG: hypothetical protein AB7P52_05210 [Alphaproteobacteria bacterium]
MSDEALTPRQLAEQRVHDRFEKRRSDLFKRQRAALDALLRRQNEERSRLKDKKALARQQKQEALDAHDRYWKLLENRRLSNATNCAPSPGASGRRRDVKAEHDERREQWLRQGEAIEKAFDERLETLRDAEIDLVAHHSRQRDSHERCERLAQDDLARRQAKSFESAVRRELAVGERGAQRAFVRHARDAGRER